MASKRKNFLSSVDQKAGKSLTKGERSTTATSDMLQDDSAGSGQAWLEKPSI